AQVAAQPRLSPFAAAATAGVHRYGGAGMDLAEPARDRIQVLRHHPALDHRVALAALVVGVAEIAEHRPGIDPGVDAQQGHADALEVAFGQGPEAAVGVAVLR